MEALRVPAPDLSKLVDLGELLDALGDGPQAQARAERRDGPDEGRVRRAVAKFGDE